MTLPARPVPSTPTRPMGPETPDDRSASGATPRRVLVVEDEIPIRLLLARMLTRRGYAVTEASSCAEAEAAIGRAPFTLVLCDLRLGDGNGVEFLRRLRPVHVDIDRRFVLVTGDIAALAEHEREFGPLAVLPKPFTASDLDRVLAGLSVLI